MGIFPRMRRISDTRRGHSYRGKCSRSIQGWCTFQVTSLTDLSGEWKCQLSNLSRNTSFLVRICFVWRIESLIADKIPNSSFTRSWEGSLEYFPRYEGMNGNATESSFAVVATYLTPKTPLTKIPLKASTTLDQWQNQPTPCELWLQLEYKRWGTAIHHPKLNET